MSKKSPKMFFAPIVIAGITIGFLASAYQFIYAQKKRMKNAAPEPQTDQNEEER